MKIFIDFFLHLRTNTINKAILEILCFKYADLSMEISLNDSSILGQVALTREARIVNKAYEYKNFNRRVDAETKFTTVR